MPTNVNCHSHYNDRTIGIVSHLKCLSSFVGISIQQKNDKLTIKQKTNLPFFGWQLLHKFIERTPLCAREIAATPKNETRKKEVNG